jgi:putative DNA methylase
MSSKTVAVKSPRKLIEVALPLDKINAACAREKSIRHGHPSTLHLWWARRPLAAARAVLFAQLVNDPGYERHLNRGVNKVEAAKERERLFRIIEDLVIWENTNNEEVLGRARAEIGRSWRETCELNRNHPDATTLFDPDKLPAFHDPFAGGGAIPLEAQRLGLESYASDLNPVAVTINKAMIEIPPRFAGRAPIGPLPAGERDASLSRKDWPGATGLAEDVRRYGAWMRTEAEKRIGHLYPKVEITAEMANGIPGQPETARPDLKPLVGQKLTVIAWLWARTVKSPNPAYSHVDVPLVSTFVLSSKSSKEAYVHPVVEGNTYRFEVRKGIPPEGAENGTKLARGANFKCIMSNGAIDSTHIYGEARAHRMGSKLMAIVAEGPSGRVYLPPQQIQQHVAQSAQPASMPELEMPKNPRWFSPPMYGLTRYGDLFTSRQLVALNALSDLVGEAAIKCENDALNSNQLGRVSTFSNATAAEYGASVALYLAFIMSKLVDINNGLAPWGAIQECPLHLFSRHAIPMTWDFAEANPLSTSSGSWKTVSIGLQKGMQITVAQADKRPTAFAEQANAMTQVISKRKVISTDPPYYDNIGYADLSDFFYVWLRRSLAKVMPDLFSTKATPKLDELVAIPSRHGSRAESESFFLTGMKSVFSNLNKQSHPAFPVTVYYAFKQSESNGDDATSSTGWVTFLEAVLDSGWVLDGTWPLRTERAARAVGQGTNALASSIVLVCRKREADASSISRSQFLRELRATLPDALTEMTRGGENSPVAPVDLSQAIIGPGMGIFSRYKAVLEADGTPMSVKTALQLINRALAGDDDDFDPETRFCLQWFETNYWKEGLYGQADVAARAKGTGLEALARAGVLRSGGGKVQLLRPAEFTAGWSPEQGNQTPVWEGLHHLIHSLNTNGEQAAGRLLAAMPSISGPARTLSYRLYTLCERQKLAEDARTYNELIGSWAAVEVAAQEHGYVETQADLFQR